MDRYKAIVVALDLIPDGSALTSGSVAAVEELRWIGRAGGVRATLVHSVSTDRYVERSGTWVVMHEGLSGPGRTTLDEIVASLSDAGIQASLEVVQEKPFLATIQRAHAVGADLILVGRHDEGEADAPFGSTSIRIVRKSPIPVWVARPGMPAIPRKVLAATDLSAVGAQAIEIGGEVAKSAGAELHVVHAYQVDMETQLAASRHPERLDELRDRVIRAVGDQVARVDDGGGARQHVMCSTPVRALVALDRELRPDLVVLGSVSRGGVPGLLIGNTAEKALPRLQASLLVIKPKDFVSPIRFG